MVTELASASPRVIFGGLLRGDADGTRGNLNCFVSKTVSVTQTSMTCHREGLRRLNVVVVKVNGTENHALLDTAAVSNLMSLECYEKLEAPMQPSV